MDEQGKELLNKDFARTLLPSNFEDDPSLVEEMVNALAKDKDMKNPRPDWTFGFQRRKFPLSIGIPIPERVLNFLEIVPGMHHPFLITEGKSFEGNMSTAENQARRGGATLVQAARALRKELEMDEPVSLGAGANIPTIRPDYNSFMFSITMSPQIFQIHVHWFDEATGIYHMNGVESYALKNSKGPREIREAMHNIFEWGLRSRHRELASLTESIKGYARRAHEKVRDDCLAAQAAKTIPRKRPRAVMENAS